MASADEAPGPPDLGSYKLEVVIHEDHVIHVAKNGERITWVDERRIGAGGFGVVRVQKAVVAGKETRRAVKSVSRDFYVNHKLNFERELQASILVQDYPELFLEFFGWYEDNSRFFMVMEYAALGDLGCYIKEFEEDGRSNATSITRQVLDALVVLHERKLYHRDLKPSNVLVVSVSPLRVKLVDFGASKSTINSRLKTFCGTISYCAPEMLGYLNPVYQLEREYPSAVDIWALGCLVHAILTGETPFLHQNVHSNMVQDLNVRTNELSHLKPLESFCLGETPLPTEKLESSGADTTAIDFIKRLLVVQPDSRPSAMEALDHVWLLGCKSFEKFELQTTVHADCIVHRTLGPKNRAIFTTWLNVAMIGGGGFGSVSLQKGSVRGIECGLRAVKTVHRDVHKMGLSREVSSMIAVQDHPEMFIRLFGWFETPGYFNIAMEYLEHGDLSGYLLQLGSAMRPQIADITRQILKGLVVLHERDICHRDLKPQNVLVSSLSPVRVKLADFGASKVAKGTELRTRVGTSGYIAPELLGLWERRHSRDSYTNAIDMWSVGCLVYKMVTVSELPFTSRSSDTFTNSTYVTSSVLPEEPMLDVTMLHGYCRGEFGFPTEALVQGDMSSRGIDLIKRLLVPNPELRMEAKEALEHKWFTEQELESSDVLEKIKAEIISLVETNPEKTESLIRAYSKDGNPDTICSILMAMGESPESLVYKASDKGYIFLLDMLLHVFAGSTEILISTFKGCTLMHTAVKRGHLRVVELLLKYGIDVNAEPGAVSNGRTALQSAAEHGHLQLVKFLIKRGANIHSKPARTGGLTALQAAASRGHSEILRYLIIEHKADVNEEPCEVNGRTSLQAAAENGYIATVDSLLRYGAKVNAPPCAKTGRTALQAAASNGHLLIVRMLLENSAEVNAGPCSCWGRTALQAAAEKGHSKVVRLLLDNSADTNAEPCNKGGKTALWAAAESGYSDIVRLLLKYGADTNCQRCGSTALEIAEENGNFEIMEILSENPFDKTD